MTDTNTRTRILIAEDVEITRLGLSTVLGNQPDFEVLGEAIDGESAVTQAKQLHPHLILMDIGLPKLNGIDATRQIKDALPETKILMFTSSEDEEKVLAALGAGANGYCTKTVPPSDLMEIIRYVAKGATWLDPSIAAIALKIFTAPALPSVNPSQNRQPDDYNLTTREMEVLTLLVEGNSNAGIGKELWISSNTAKAHVASIMNKLLVNDRVQAAVKAVREGLLSQKA